MSQTKRSRLTDDSAAVRRLHQMFDCGELTGEEAAPDVKKWTAYFSHFCWLLFGTNTTRSKRRKLKNMLLNSGAFLQTHANLAEDEEDVLAEEDEIDDNLDDSVVGKKQYATEFTPLVLKSAWEHAETLVNYLCLALLLPVGITEENVSGQVVKRVNVFEVVINWPEVMTNPKLLFKAWLTKHFQPLQDYHSKIGGFEKALKELRAEKSEQIQSFCHIELPFDVESHVLLKKMLNFGEGMRVFYVELKAPENRYVKSDDIEEIVVN
ncbi:hypothetical protein FGB62_47g021 [Gracilaria domingensis]|nr:hypothetical protein FGB62_47g021 [Gracilaria domingensis]